MLQTKYFSLAPSFSGASNHVSNYPTLLGYRYREVPLDKLPPVKEGTVITEPDVIGGNERIIVAKSLGCHVRGAALPHPDPSDSETMIAGVTKRFAVRPPEIDRNTLRRFGKFVDRWLEENFVPLSADTDLSFETWLAETDYPEWRKDELRKSYEEDTDLSKVDMKRLNRRQRRLLECKSFMKDEHYEKYKHARGINSRHDRFKCHAGPLFKAIEKVVYAHPAFIKHVPVADRPKYIMDRLYRSGAKYLATDYTSFESLFRKIIMKKCEFKLYRYMLRHLTEVRKSLLLKVLGGRNKCRYRNFVVELEATRMSGEMCTSLGNGFSNLMFMLFTCSEKGATNVVGVVEGDDGLFSMDGPIPNEDDFKKLGLVIKAEVHLNIETASFCGMVFDIEDRLIVTDPRKVLCSFGWTGSEYWRAKPQTLLKLLRAKSLSLAYQYPGCPILGALAEYGLRVTACVEKDAGWKDWFLNRRMNSYERERARQVMASIPRTMEPPTNTRLLVERLYGIPVNYQRRIEEYLHSLNSMQELDHPMIADLMKSEWVHYYGHYSCTARGEKPYQPMLNSYKFQREWSYHRRRVVPGVT